MDSKVQVTLKGSRCNPTHVCKCFMRSAVLFLGVFVCTSNVAQAQERIEEQSSNEQSQFEQQKNESVTEVKAETISENRQQGNIQQPFETTYKVENRINQIDTSNEYRKNEPSERINTASVTQQLRKREETQSTNVKDSVPNPHVEAIQYNFQNIEGSTLEGSQVVVMLPSGNKLTTVSDTSGHWSINALDTLYVGDVVQIYAKKEGYADSKRVRKAVIDTIAPPFPRINALEVDERIVSGIAEKNTTVRVTFSNGQVVETNVDEEGLWSLEVPQTVPFEFEERISVVVVDQSNNVSTEVVKQVGDTIKPRQPGVKNMEYGTNILRGTGSKYKNYIVALLPDGTTVFTQIGRTLTWMLGIPNAENFSAGSEILVEEMDLARNYSPITIARIVDTIPPDIPHINPVSTNTSQLSGTAERGSKVKISLPNGEYLLTKVQMDGTWQIVLPSEMILHHGDTVRVEATDSSGNHSEVLTVYAQGEGIPQPPDVNHIEAGTKVITGTAAPGQTVCVTFAEYLKIKRTVQADGTWQVRVPTGRTLCHGNQVTVHIENNFGVKSREITMNVADTIAPKDPKIYRVEEGDKVLKGYGEKRSTFTLVFADGKKIKGKVSKNGGWRVKLPEDIVLKRGDVLGIKVVDTAGNKSRLMLTKVKKKRIVSTS
ncbi:Ig-like domain-containing protein [Staphylococcus sp. 17KM0847]|uniref:Ig-like domain-containing protein n=1 Tax=Staphylococcus sp. 17KM0847 TaxID=2583989 RepID=UPI0015DE10E4|nr:Ig-like domain-containing protein [Staphylococcus sp. 17KM0847]